MITRSFQPVNPNVMSMEDVQRALRRTNDSMFLFHDHINDHPWVYVDELAFESTISPVYMDWGFGDVLDVEDWQDAHAYVLGEWMKPVAIPNGCIYECVDAGNSAAVEPAWGTTIGDDTVDNGVIWRCRGCHCIQMNVDYSASIIERTPIVYVASDIAHYGVIELVLDNWIVFSGAPLKWTEKLQALRFGYASQIEQRHLHIENPGDHDNNLELHMGEFLLWDRQKAHIATFAARTIGGGSIDMNILVGDPPATAVSVDQGGTGLNIPDAADWYWNELTSIERANAIISPGDRLDIQCSAPVGLVTDLNVEILFVSEDRDLARILTSLQTR